MRPLLRCKISNGKHMKLKHWLMVAAFGLLLGCASAEIGEACDTSGSADECVDGSVCTNHEGALTCLKSCTEQADCTADEDCNGISGTNVKTCQAKTSKK